MPLGARARVGLVTVLLAAIPAAAPPAVLAVATQTSTVSEFDATGEWAVDSGSASISVVASPHTSGSGSLKVAYDFSVSGGASIRPTSTPPAHPGLPRRMSIDVYGDGSWNVVYLEVSDATGEVLRYWLGNLSFTGWQTMSVDLGTKKPISGLAGNADGQMDLPVSSYRVVLWKNNAALKTKSTVYIDHLSYEYEPGGVPRSDPPVFVPSAGGSAVVRVTLAEAGDYTLVLTDEIGQSRTLSGSAQAGVEATQAWNGKDGAGHAMRGSVRASFDVVRGTKTYQYQIPYFAGLPVRTSGQSPALRGINSFVSEIDTRHRAKAETEARSMEDAWVGMAREEFEWKRVEPEKGRFDWSKFDQLVQITRAHGIQVLGKLVYTAPWASSAPSGTSDAAAQYWPPKDVQDYAAYVRAVVHRYKDRVHVWEVWNEENTTGFWRPAADPAAYTRLLVAASAAIRAEDPTATIVLGGLSTGADPAFLKVIHDNGGWGAFDVLAIHTYVAGPPDGSMMVKWFDDAHAAAAAYGSKQIWVTEFGWSTYSGSGTGYIGVTAAEQASYLARSYQLASEQGITGMSWFELVDRGTAPSSRADHYGIVTTSLTAKPAYGAFQCVARSIAVGGPVGCATVQRVAGVDRYATAAAVSRSAFGTNVPVAYIATGANFPDALAAAAAAGAAGGPVLLVSGGSIPASTATELTRLRPTKIVVAGGSAVVSDSVLAQLGRFADTVQRVAGVDRYATAAAVSRSAFGTNVPVAYIATGANFPDALAAAAAAGAAGGPVLLVSGGSIPASTATELTRLRPTKIVVAGGSAVVSDSVLAQLGRFADTVQRVAGVDRYATAAAVSRSAFGTNVPVAYIATGANFPDALAAAAAAGAAGGPVLLVSGGSIPASTATELTRLRPTKIVVAGGSAVVSNSVLAQLAAY